MGVLKWGVFMDYANARKISYLANSIVFFFVLCMWIFFYSADVRIMSIFSIPTACVYIINYFLISRKKLDVFISFTYFWIIIYMCLATICFGINYGFHLYCMSLIPVIFCSDYMAYKINAKRINALGISIAIAIAYLICTGYVVRFGAIYQDVPSLYANIFLGINAFVVFGFLISYTTILIKLIIKSEENLKEIALKDKLTGLYNRHYTTEYLANLHEKADEKNWLAMLDIDDFKGFNDKYGHDCGDEVLIHISEMMQKNCPDCLISRWGGEEFIIVNGETGANADIALLEKLRENIEQEYFEYGGKKLTITVTIGVATFDRDMTLDDWINEADKRMYFGKKNGKNCVIKN